MPPSSAAPARRTSKPSPSLALRPSISDAPCMACGPQTTSTGRPQTPQIKSPWATSLVLALAITGCSSDFGAEPLNMNAFTLPAADQPPPLLTVAGWAAAYGYKPVPTGTRLDSWSWTPPTTGAPVDHYVVEATWTTKDNATPAAILVPDSVSFTIRVAGVDSLGRQGPWSNCGSF